MKHGYTGYSSHGCRCEVCREAKREYMRALRAVTKGMRRLAVEDDAVVIKTRIPIKHGISGYQDHGCRCGECRRAKAEARTRESRVRQRVA